MTYMDLKRYLFDCMSDTTKRLMCSPKCRSVKIINNPARPGSNHKEVNYNNNNNNNKNNNNNNDDDDYGLKRTLRCKINMRIK